MYNIKFFEIFFFAAQRFELNFFAFFDNFIIDINFSRFFSFRFVISISNCEKKEQDEIFFSYMFFFFSLATKNKIF